MLRRPLHSISLQLNMVVPKAFPRQGSIHLAYPMSSCPVLGPPLSRMCPESRHKFMLQGARPIRNLSWPVLFRIVGNSVWELKALSPVICPFLHTSVWFMLSVMGWSPSNCKYENASRKHSIDTDIDEQNRVLFQPSFKLLHSSGGIVCWLSALISNLSLFHNLADHICTAPFLAFPNTWL